MKLNIKKRMAIIAAIGCLSIGGIVTGCTEADKVSNNVSKEADNFNVLRRFAVINTRTDKVEFEIVGAFSLEDEGSKKVKLIVETANGSYKKHIVHMNRDSMYVIEDLGGAKVNKYKYEVNYIPESIVPFKVTESK